MTPTQILSAQPVPVSVLTAADFANAALVLGCEERAIRAVSGVETGARGAFDSQGRPTILFERHLFHHATHARFDNIAPDLSNATPGGYGTYAAQYERLARAMALDEDAAIASASWGAFQILGEYHVLAGYDSVENMVAAMRTGVGAHLLAFAHFVTANPPMLRALRAKDWHSLAIAYNGRGEASNHYDLHLAESYEKAA